MGRDHPDTRFYGMDLVNVTDAQTLPKNCEVVLGDILKGKLFSKSYA
jgi:hypothetical protein